MNNTCSTSLFTRAAKATIFAASLFAATMAQAGVLTFTDTTLGGPTWNRPLTTTTLSGVGTNVAYDVTNIRVDQSGSYSVFSQSLVPAAWDNYLVLYANAFSATSPLTNIVTLNDDFTPGSFGQAGFTINLTAGIDYYLVETGFSNFSAGSYSTVITGLNGGTASIVGATSVPEPASIALLSLGLLGFAYANRLKRR